MASSCDDRRVTARLEHGHQGTNRAIGHTEPIRHSSGRELFCPAQVDVDPGDQTYSVVSPANRTRDRHGARRICSTTVSGTRILY
jgi:hypothetical protein